MKFGTNLYYSNEQTDEVLNFKTYTKKIDKNYKYIHKNPFYNLWSFFTYRFIATPLAWLYYRIIKRVKFINKEILKQHKKSGYFIYANHTNQTGDALFPGLICFPKKPYIVVNSANLCIPLIGGCLKMWGALPIPDTIEATKNFNNSIDYLLNKNNPIVIYPEAHLWPYYTKIRNFSSTSFKYPVRLNKPVFTFTTIYKLKKHSKKPKVEVYVDGPFYPDLSLQTKQSQQKLRDEIYTQMVLQSQKNNYEYVNYIKRGTND